MLLVCLRQHSAVQNARALQILNPALNLTACTLGFLCKAFLQRWFSCVTLNSCSSLKYLNKSCG